MSPALSVVIPTYKRADILKRCIDHLENQTIRDDIDVIVVHDGPGKETEEMLKDNKWNVEVVFAEIEKAQQGAARNKGTDLATGDIVLFIGDDIFLEPTTCEAHRKAHEKNAKEAPIAVLGYTTWDPACGITPLMRWLERTGWQFGYPMIKKYAHDFLPPHLQHLFTYGSNISVPLDVAQTHRFMTKIHLYGWEDTEWGHRQKEAGIRLYYEPDAKALHHHHIELADSLKRAETLGRSLKVVEQHSPSFHLHQFEDWKHLFVYRLSTLLPTFQGKHMKAFLKGFKGN